MKVTKVIFIPNVLVCIDIYFRKNDLFLNTVYGLFRLTYSQFLGNRGYEDIDLNKPLKNSYICSRRNVTITPIGIFLQLKVRDILLDTVLIKLLTGDRRQLPLIAISMIFLSASHT